MSKPYRTQRPAPGTYSDYFQPYIDQVPEGDILQTLAAHLDAVPAFFEALPSGKWDYRYAPDKWTPKDILQHLIDTERVFSYRALRIARSDTTPLPSFDENLFAREAFAGRRHPEALLAEYRAVRTSTLFLYLDLPDEAWLRQGQAGGGVLTPQAVAWCLAGHELHHLDVLRTRYLD